MSKVSNKKSRRLAYRAIEVLNRNNNVPAISFHGPTLGASAVAVIGGYDQLLVMAQERRETKEQRDAKVAKLLWTLRKWVGLASTELSAFRPEEFRPAPGVADDIISAATGFVGVIDEHELKTGVPLHFSEVLHADMVSALEAAKQNTTKAAELEVMFTRARRELRLACDRFNADLVAFRSTLEATIGRADPDYQRLRVSRIRGDEDDDFEDPVESTDPTEPTEPTPVSGEAAAE